MPLVSRMHNNELDIVNVRELESLGLVCLRRELPGELSRTLSSSLASVPRLPRRPLLLLAWTSCLLTAASGLSPRICDTF